MSSVWCGSNVRPHYLPLPDWEAYSVTAMARPATAGPLGRAVSLFSFSILPYLVLVFFLSCSVRTSDLALGLGFQCHPHLPMCSAFQVPPENAVLPQKSAFTFNGACPYCFLLYFSSPEIYIKLYNQKTISRAQNFRGRAVKCRASLEVKPPIFLQQLSCR